MTDYGTFEILWFTVIGVLWVGYFFLEGFDFGVGILLRVVSRDRVERRVVMHTIGPVWDGNEVWVVVAGGATFAAFPEWYATLFSGFYLPLMLIVFALVLRPVALEFWGKNNRAEWRDGWEWALTAGSAVPAFLWGLVFANIVHGVPVDRDMEFTGSVLDLLHPYALLGGLTTLLLCATHGAIYLALKTRGEVLERSRRAAAVLAPANAITVAAFATWTLANASNSRHVGVTAVAVGIAAGVAAVAVPVLLRTRSRWAFGLHGAVIALVLAMLFLDLYPSVLVSGTNSAFNLTLASAASGTYTLKVMTVVAAVLIPTVLAGQAWVYRVFRTPVGREDFGETG